jgi:N-acetylglutamate synthase-like GNAT family acetyltransferase
MEIRKIQQADLSVCAKLLEDTYSLPPYNEIFKEHTPESYINSKYNTCKDNSFVVVDDKDSIIGFIFINTSAWSQGPQAIIEEVVVAPNYQNKGVGRELLEYAHNYLESLDVKSIMVWAKKDDCLLDFYKNQGYSLADDFVVMFKNLQN